MAFKALHDLAQVINSLLSYGILLFTALQAAWDPFQFLNLTRLFPAPEPLHLLVPLLECSFSSYIEQFILVLQILFNINTFKQAVHHHLI